MIVNKDLNSRHCNIEKVIGRHPQFAHGQAPRRLQPEIVPLAFAN
jgi:hypothetical protein